MMSRTLVVLSLLTTIGLAGACNSGSAPVQTNANVNQNLNSNTAPANVGVVQNNNGNENTAGVRPVNANKGNQNSNSKPGNGNR
jgi:hypothetical protein